MGAWMYGLSILHLRCSHQLFASLNNAGIGRYRERVASFVLTQLDRERSECSRERERLYKRKVQT